MATAFIRSSATRQFLGRSACRYSTSSSPAANKNNLGLFLGAAGVVGLGTYAYLQYGGASQQVDAMKAKQSSPQKSPLDPDNFVDFTLKKIEPYNHNTAKFILELPGNATSQLPVASCVYIKAADPNALNDEKGKPIMRPYTPISAPDEPGELTFLIKQYPEGKVSKYVHTLKPGDKLSIKGPIPKIPYKINEFEEIGMIAGGSGIAPMHQVLKYALGDKSNKTRFTLIFANITPKDILLKEEFDDLQKKFPDTFKVVYTVDKPEKGWNGATGYVNKDLVQKHIPPPNLGNKMRVFICGPPGQVASIAGKKDGREQGALDGLLKDMGYKQEQVFKF